MDLCVCVCATRFGSFLTTEYVVTATNNGTWHPTTLLCMDTIERHTYVAIEIEETRDSLLELMNADASSDPIIS